jgi:hypothetical protein
MVLTSVFNACDPIDGVELYTLVVNTNPQDSGYVKITPHQTVYKESEIVTLTAQNTDEYIFDHWEGDISDTNSTITVVMDDNKEVTAYYNIIEQPSITVSAESNPIPNGADPGYQFDDTYIEQNPQTVLFQIKNQGNSALTINNVELSEGNINEFQLDTTNLNYSLNPGDVTEFSIAFNPGNPGNWSAMVHIDSNDNDNPIYEFSVRGKALWIPGMEVRFEEEIMSSGDLIDFPTIDVDFQSGEAILIIANKGMGDLHIDKIGITGSDDDDFILNTDAFTNVLRPMEETQVSVVFAPLYEGDREARLAISCDDPTAQEFYISLHGTGNGYPEIEIIKDTKSVENGEYPAYDFGSWMFHGWTQHETFIIKNSGHSTLQIDNISKDGWIYDFHFEFDDVDYTLSPGEETYIYIVFTPIRELTVSADVLIESNDRDDPLFTLTVMGTGTADSEAEISVVDDYDTNFKYIFDEDDPGYEYGTIDVGENISNEFTVISHGHHLTELVLYNVEITGEDADQFIITKDIEEEISIPTYGGTYDIPIMYRANKAGEVKANLEISSNDPDEPIFNFTLVGFGNTYSSIEVEDGNSKPISNDSRLIYNIRPSQNDTVLPFTINSVGEKMLEVNEVSMITDYPDNFQLVIDESGTIVDPNTIMLYDVIYSFDDIGTKTATIQIDNNDAMNNPFVYEIVMKAGDYSDINIINNDTYLNNNGVVDFNDVYATTEQTIPLQIESAGTLPLDINSISLSGSDADQFTLIDDEVQPIIDAGDTNPLYIKFNPTTTGVKEATVIIDNNSLNKERFIFTVTGNSLSAPDIEVENAGTPINEGSIYNIGSTFVKEGTEAVIDISNLGIDPLYIDDIVISGDNPDQFAIDDFYLLDFLEPGDSTEFTLAFKPTSYGRKTATVSILTNDPDENPFNFRVTGMAEVNSSMTVSYQGTTIENGSDTGYVFNDTMFGETDTAVLSIENNGADTLSIFNIITEEGDATQFIINDYLTSSQIEPGQSTTVEITFAPSSIGYKSSLLVIDSNDSENDPYVFVIRGDSPGPIDEYIPFPGDHDDLIDWQELIISYVGDDDMEWFDDNGDANSLTINGDVRIWATFVYEEAGYQNRFGYFAFNEAPAEAVGEEERVTIYDNASAEGSGGDLLIGDSLFLGQFNDEDRSNIGFWTHQDGYRYPDNPYWWSTFDEGTYGVDPGQWNEDSYRHMVMFVDKHQHAPGEMAYIVLGMEDLTNLGDRDFDDLIIVLTIEPVDPTQTFEDIVDTGEMLSIDDLRNYINSK